MFRVKAGYYANPDNFGESYVLTSDNQEAPLRLEIGTKVKIIPLCQRCEEKEAVKNLFCEECYQKSINY